MQEQSASGFICRNIYLVAESELMTGVLRRLQKLEGGRTLQHVAFVCC